RYREEVKGSKYFILCSWPGYEDIFPYVDEYWSVSNLDFYNNAEGFCNRSDIAVRIQRNLNYFFEDVAADDVFSQFYQNGLTKGFFDRFKHIRRFLPSVASASMLGNDFSRDLTRLQGNKV